MVRKVILVSVGVVVLYFGAYGLAQSGRDSRRAQAKTDSLPALDAHRFNGVQEITRPELVKLMTKFRPLSKDESANLDRGCPGLACVYQGLGLRRWPELACDTVAYLSRKEALKRHCPNGEENFVFIKQGCWLAGTPPTSNRANGEVPVNSVTRTKPGLFTFGYAVYFPSTATYAWMNHSDYGFPANLIKPQKAYLSSFPPPLDEETRPAQIYCSTCR
jgi:hypothetical protein